jgi:RNA polymerase sigma-70 factor (ECF subfamily)
VLFLALFVQGIYMNSKGKIRTMGIGENFEQIFKEYFKVLTYYSQKMVHDHDSAKEIVHSVFIKLWEKKDEIHMDKPLRSYLFTAVHNASLNYLRNQSKFYSGDFSELENRAELYEEMKDGIEEAETEAKIMSVIAALPEKCRQVFKLSRFEGKKYKEIAAVMNISVKTVEIQMSKALRILREELKDYLDAFILLLLLFLFKSQ